jgi:GntR family histidine utilization transcriptional repressor
MPRSSAPNPSPAATIRADLESAIRSGTWQPGARIPTEHALMAQYGCARMTVHKVLASLAERGLIVRRRRAGSFVAPPPAEHAILTIADFAAEAAQSGRAYRHEILSLTQPPGADPVVAVTCRHFFDHLPVALEIRSIRIAAIPAVTRARFRAEPPGAWLLRHAPWSEAEHEITAATAPPATAAQLDMLPGAALLCLHRRTWHAGMLITDVRFSFPADRYRFTGRFAPSRNNPHAAAIAPAGGSAPGAPQGTGHERDLAPPARLG